VNLSSPKPLTISFVAPKAIVKKKTISLNKKAENKVPKSSWKYSNVIYDDGITATKKVKTAKFNTDHSPFKFRSYLTVYTATKDDKIKDVLNFEKLFYLAEIRNSGKLPLKNIHYKNSKGDMFYSPR
jgi:aspartate carbamoyltransferase catalytic subunit